MLHLSFANRFATLLDDLLARLAAERSDPFTPRQIIVPSVAIARHIELAVADREGVCANIEFAFLGQWLWRQMARIVPIGRESPFAPELLAWRVYAALGDTAFTQKHARLGTYLGDADPMMRLDLARRIAQLLENYVTYRPRELAAWSAGRASGIAGLDGTARQDEAWQAALWRRIAAEIGATTEHPSVAFFREVGTMDHAALAERGLPDTAHVFCLPSLPPLYLEMLRQLSRVTRLQLYVLNPCREYWFEVVDRKRLGWLTARGKAEHQEVGNSLLAAWGRQTQAHIDLLYSGEDEVEETLDEFAASDRETLLGGIQDAILDLAELPAGSVALADDDRSLEVHVCHSLTRELEVLHDQLLARFAGPHPPRPQDVLVVTPRLDEAAPLIDAVFGTVPPARRIPYAITGQAQRRVNPIARALDTLIAVTAGRHPASAVFDLLMLEPVALRYGLDGSDLEQVRGWIEAAGIRWALEAEQRGDVGVPASEHHTFADGLQRLFLGYALGNAPASVDGRIAAGHAEGQGAAALGAFWRFAEDLRRLRRDWRAPKDARGWREAIGQALERFVADAPPWADEYRAVRRALADLYDQMARGGLNEAVPLAVVRAALAELLDESARGSVPSGKVTFAAPGSLRNLPYRVVCAIGMDDGAFPTAGHPLEFDLIALAPRRGDRQRRIDERNLFLDLVLAAREQLYLSYTGRSVRDNSPRPPSVLVAELLDYALRACSRDAQDEQAVRRRLVVEHPLQPYSPEHFTPDADPRKRSFNAEYCAALRERLRATGPITPQVFVGNEDDHTPDPGLPFFAAPLEPPGAEWRVVQLEQLRRFFANPCRYLLRERLRIALPELDEELLDDEPFLPDFASRQAMAERLLGPALAGASADELAGLARAGNEFPAGALGDAVLEREVRVLLAYAEGLRADLGAETGAPRTAALGFRVADEDWQLQGIIADVRGDALVRSRYDDTRPADYLAGWLDHLFACAAFGACTTRWHSRDGVYVLPPYADARARLAELLALYREGLRAPLPFFAKSGWAYVTSGGQIAKAWRRWSNWKTPRFGEGHDPAYRIALRNVVQPLDARFAELATRVLGPLREHVQDPRL